MSVAEAAGAAMSANAIEMLARVTAVLSELRDRLDRIEAADLERHAVHAASKILRKEFNEMPARQSPASFFNHQLIGEYHG